ncbi:MAG: DNA methyltransferase [Deltaproteobacteria bacterium]|nr:DNA methyltransferase [Deltaproteobacteria bacterium]
MQLTFLEKPESRIETGDWTFNGVSTRELTHCYHDYPARMIPQVAGKILDLFGHDAKLLFDPYLGTGTSLVEGMIRGINVAGTDLNPLARLIARAKTSVPDLRLVDRHIGKFNKFVFDYTPSPLVVSPTIQGVSRLEFWFKKGVIEKLYRLREFMQSVEDASSRLFFQVAFSETIRESSNTRNDEFKLYRYDAAKLAAFNPDVFTIMSRKLQRNRAGLEKYLFIIKNFKNAPVANVYDFNTVMGIPQEYITPATVDIVVTSPPYGDSHTTVAYGQYSRLSAAWLELKEPDKIDRKLMGGVAAKKGTRFNSNALNSAIERIYTIDKKRALEVSAFYSDLLASISNVAQIIKPMGYACYVVGNRKVKGVVLPTDIAVKDFFESCGFEYVNTFMRSIPNKRMPLKNSPTNAIGVLDSTMTQEYIVVMRRAPARSVFFRLPNTSARA